MNAPPGPPKARAILKAAERLFLQFGFRRTAMDDIARAAGVAKGTLYLYFNSKEAVFRTLQARLHAEIITEAEAALATRGAFADRLFRVLYALHGELLARFGGSEHLLELVEARDRLDHEGAEALKAEHQAILVRLFSEADASGEIDLTGGGLSAEVCAAAASAAAVGAKPQPGGQGAVEAYAARLREVAAVLAAAVRKAG